MANRIYRMSEVAEHKSSDSLWICIDNLVYDVTKFVQEHPGGEEVLHSHGGLDATDSFEDVGHSNDARSLMTQYHIGKLHEDDCVDHSDIKTRTYETGNESSGGSLFTTVVIPVVIGLCAVMAYRLYMQQN